MKILAVESSATAASAAVAVNGVIIAEYFINAEKTHSETLLPMVSQMLKAVNIDISEIDRFAVAEGPGSFTGLRIGIATIKGLMAFSDRECVPLSTLEVIASAVPETDGVICAVMDARCNQVYNALFEYKNGGLSRLCEDRALTIPELRELVAKTPRVILTGDGAEVCYTSTSDLDNISLSPPHLRFQRAGAAALLAQNKEAVRSPELTPKYLRLPQAERELKKKLGEDATK